MAHMINFFSTLKLTAPIMKRLDEHVSYFKFILLELWLEIISPCGL